MKRRSTRREFLRGKAAAEALAEAARSGLPPQGPSGSQHRRGLGYVVRIGRCAMACQFEVCLNAGQYAQGTQAALDALDLVEALEDQLSYFRANSELSRINRTADRQPVEVEPRLFELLELAMRISGETSGALDLTSTPLWEAWGFARRAGSVPSEEQLAEALQRVGSQWVELDRRQRSIRFRREGVRLNLGSIGKGYALDRCAEALLHSGVHDFLLHGGYSSMLARGSQAAAAAGGDASAAWLVDIRHPLRPKRRLAEVRLRDRGLSTSGSGAQSFRHQGHRYGHILDPRTGRPAEAVLSATVIAPSAALAEALSTAFSVMGPEAALEYCRQRPELGVVLSCPVRHSGGIATHWCGLSEAELTLL
jgi:thiamine biosynthesis lipoprotein